MSEILRPGKKRRMLVMMVCAAISASMTRSIRLRRGALRNASQKQTSAPTSATVEEMSSTS